MFKILPNYLHYTQSGAGGSTTIVNSGSLSGSLPFYNVGDFPSFQSAITSLGTKPATLYISSGVTITSNVVIPRNIDLIFTNSGSITVSDGVTGVHLGNIQAPPHQIFFNIYSGQGAMNFYNAALQNLKIQKYYLPWWAGTGGYKGDSKSGIQAAIDAVYINSTLYAPFGCNYLIASPISMYGKYGVNLIAENGNGYQNLGQPFSNFKWSGQSGGTMLEMQHCSHCKVDGWGFDALNSISGALICINIDGEGNPTSTQNTISNNYFRCSPLTGSIGLSISKEAVSNNEFMTLEKNIFSAYGYHSGYGLYMGRSSNAHGHVLRDNGFFYFKHGIHMDNGSFKMEGINNFNSNELDIYMNDTAYPTIIRGADSESSYQFAYINAQNNPIVIDSCRMQSSGHSETEGLIKFGVLSRWVTVTNNIMNNIQTSTGYVFDGREASALNLITANNRYPDNYTYDQIYKDCWRTSTSPISFENGQIIGQIVGRGKAGSAESEYPPFKFSNVQSGNHFLNIMINKVTGALEWDFIRMYITQSGLIRQPIAYTTDITGAYALITGGGGNITNRISGSGVLNYIPRFINSSGVVNSTIISSGLKVGIGTTFPKETLDITGHFRMPLSRYYSISRTNLPAASGGYAQLGYFSLLNQGGAAGLLTFRASLQHDVSNDGGMSTKLYDFTKTYDNVSNSAWTEITPVLNTGPRNASQFTEVVLEVSGIQRNDFYLRVRNKIGNGGGNFRFNIIAYDDLPFTEINVTGIDTVKPQIYNFNKLTTYRGNVGIGVVEPQYLLHMSGGYGMINGSLSVSGYITGTNIVTNNIRGLTGNFAKILLSGSAPSSFNSVGFSGQLALSGTNLYICTGNNAWGRIPILDF